MNSGLKLENILRTEKLSVGYDGKSIVKDINISALKGRIVTIIGPNGAGKTTVIKTITGLIKKQSGEVYIQNENMTQVSRTELSKQMAVMLTDRPHTELMTVRDVVSMGRYPYTGRFGILGEEDNRAVKEAMELTGVIDLSDADYSKISDGQKQRVMLAKVICQEPEVIVLDEPTSFLDIRYKLEFMSVLQELTRTKKLAVIMSLHELDIARRVSDLIICVKGDGIDRIGAPIDIFEDGYIESLYGLKMDYRELAKAEGEVKTFVIAGAGTGAELFRALQREGEAFATGILREGDIDLEVASALSDNVIRTGAYDLIGDDEIDRAKAIIDSCDKVYCTLDIDSLGELAKPIKLIYNYAVSCKKLHKYRHLVSEK